MIFKDKKRANTILLLESLKADKQNLYAGVAFGYAAKTLELIKKAVGESSEQYRLISALLYDQKVMNMQQLIYPADGLIVKRVKESDLYDSIIDSCIESVKAFGLYKPPSEKKNVFGDLDNSMLWTIISLIIATSFLAGIVYSNYRIDKLLQPTDKPTTQQEIHKPTKQDDVVKVAPSKKSHPSKDSTLQKKGG
jgi:hypothetical protein